MRIKSSVVPMLKKALFGCVFFLALNNMLWAQNQAPDAQDASLSIHRLTWTGDEYALRYEVLVEKRENRRYSDYHHEFTDEPYIDVPLSPGNYRFRVTPYDYYGKSGETSQWVSFELKKRVSENQFQYTKESKIFPLYVEAAWMPMLPLYGAQNEIFIDHFTFLGAGLRFGIIFLEHDAINISAEAAASWYMFESNSLGESAHVLSPEINVVLQKWISRDIFALVLRFGAGYTMLPAQIEKDEYQSLHLNMAFSFIWKPFDLFYLETGLAHAHYFTKDPSGCFRPWIGAGLMF